MSVFDVFCVHYHDFFKSQLLKCCICFEGHRDADGFDVIVSQRTRMEPAGSLTFRHQRAELNQRKSVAEVLTLGMRQRVGP